MAFDNLKRSLTSAPILAYPDYSKPFILEMDASPKGLGAVLSQRSDDSTIRVIAYASRSLRPGERSMKDYSSTKIELLALKWSVCESSRTISWDLSLPCTLIIKVNLIRKIWKKCISKNVT